MIISFVRYFIIAFALLLIIAFACLLILDYCFCLIVSMAARSRYKEWFDCDKGDIYPSEGRCVTNNFLLLVVMNSDACMLTDALIPGFS